MCYTRSPPRFHDTTIVEELRRQRSWVGFYWSSANSELEKKASQLIAHIELNILSFVPKASNRHLTHYSCSNFLWVTGQIPNWFYGPVEILSIYTTAKYTLQLLLFLSSRESFISRAATTLNYVKKSFAFFLIWTLLLLYCRCFLKLVQKMPKLTKATTRKWNTPYAYQVGIAKTFLNWKQ